MQVFLNVALILELVGSNSFVVQLLAVELYKEHTVCIP